MPQSYMQPHNLTWRSVGQENGGLAIHLLRLRI